MCQFPSWIERRGEIFYLTDRDIETWCEEHNPGKDINWYDWIGHSAIYSIFPINSIVPLPIFIDREGFPCPQEILEAIASRKMTMMAMHSDRTSIKNFPTELNGFIEYLAGSKNTRNEIKIGIVQNPNTTLDILKILIENSDPQVLWHIAQHPLITNGMRRKIRKVLQSVLNDHETTKTI